MSPRLRRLSAADARLFRAVAAQPSTLADAVLPRLTRAADHGRLWAAIAGGMALTGRPRYRRAALRGMASLGLASATTNVLAKALVRRHRPDREPVPLHRWLRRPPITSSFPSGHSASAAAFATGVALESRVLGVPAAGLAGLVGLSRVHAGVHFPSDVLAGFAIGATAAGLTTRTWPTRPQDPARAEPVRHGAPTLGDGSGLVLVTNSGSGAHRGGEEPEDALLTAFPATEVVSVGPEQDLAAELDAAAQRALVLGVAGGDGSVQAAAQAAARHGVPLAIVPAGTLNHFAADLGLAGPEDAVSALRAGDAVRVDLGIVRDGDWESVFLNTASIGGYPAVVVAREKLEKRIGKWPALAVAMARVLREDEPAQVLVDGQPRRLWLLFAGNGCYHPRGMAPTYRPSLTGGTLDVRLVDASRPAARTRLVLAALLGRLANCPAYEAREVQSLEIRSTARPLRMARDGEVDEQARASLCLSVRNDALTVYRPVDALRP